MSTAPAGPRPSVVTWGAGIGVVAGALIVVNSFDAIAGLRALDSVTPVNLWFPGLVRGSADFDRAVGYVRAWYIGVSAFAILAAVLSAYAGLGNAPARRALAPVAVVALVGATAVGLPFGVLLAAMLGLLWSPPARAWYSGSELTWPQKPAAAPPPQESYGAHRTRPQSVLFAVILTWIGAAFLAAAAVVGGVAVAANSDFLDTVRKQLPQLQNSDMSSSELRTLMLVIVVVYAVWSLVAVVLGVMALQGNNVARLFLASMAAGAGFLSLLALPVGLVTLLPASAIVFLLLSPSATEWYSRHSKDQDRR